MDRPWTECEGTGGGAGTCHEKAGMQTEEGGMERSITDRCRSARCREDRIRCFASAAGGEESGVRRCGCRRLHPTIRRWKGGPFERHERMCKEIWVGLGGTPVSDRVLAQTCHPVF
eukprot:scaffold1211_cov295-Pavlova_lutheri.AAC.11